MDLVPTSINTKFTTTFTIKATTSAHADQMRLSFDLTIVGFARPDTVSQTPRQTLPKVQKKVRPL